VASDRAVHLSEIERLLQVNVREPRPPVALAGHGGDHETAEAPVTAYALQEPLPIEARHVEIDQSQTNGWGRRERLPSLDAIGSGNNLASQALEMLGQCRTGVRVVVHDQDAARAPHAAVYEHGERIFTP
jgi:hypothetical protein